MDKGLLNATRVNQTMMECFRDMSKWLQETKNCPKTVLEESNDAIRQRGNDLYGQKKFDEAIGAYTELLLRKIDDNLRSLILSNRAQCHLQLGEYKKCIDDASESLKRNPTEKAYFRRALAYYGAGRYEVAEKDLVTCREMAINSDLATKQRIDQKLHEVRSAHARKMDEQNTHARRVLCSRSPGWTFTVPESEIKDVPIEGIKSKGTNIQIPQRGEINAPTQRYIPRCRRAVSSNTVN